MVDRDEPLFGEPSEDPDADPAEAASGEDRGTLGADEPPAAEAEPTGGSGPDLLFPLVPAGGAEVPAPEQGRPRRHEPARSSGSFWRELPVLLVVALVLAFLLRTFVVQVFYIPSSSMEPTLSIDDRMVVEKVTYLFRDPERGDVVVFEGEEEPDAEQDRSTAQRIITGAGQFLGVVPTSARDFVKRVIGLPGDEVVIEGGVVRVNGQVLDEPYVAFDDPSDYGPVTVPEGALFFLGDNRPNSSDSRRGLGFVPQERVVGRAVVIIWPPDHAGMLTGVEHDLAAAAPDGAEARR